MTPADGSDFPHEIAEARVLPASRAILLHGGRALLLFEGVETPPPLSGHLIQAGGRSLWTAECWPVEAGGGVACWHGVAVVDAVPAAGDEVRGAACGGHWRLAAPARLDIAPEPLAELVRRAGANCRDVFGFLLKHLIADRPADTAEARAHRAFARAFITAAAERDGFIELIAAPDTGGLFAQGWSMSLPAGAIILADAADDLALREVEVAHFDRDDILPPGRGFAFFGKFWREATPSSLEAVFFEEGGRLLRLDVVPGSLLLSAERATEHVAQMLPRLSAPAETLDALKRVCRPRFHGADTLSDTTAPIAAAFDAVLQAPDGTLLTFGWMLDPLRRVERVLLKSGANLYARLDTRWCPLPRPDLAAGFAGDPRFANLIDARDVMHGFVAHAPARLDQIADGQIYLELVLDDGSCLFRPLAVTRFDSAERLPQVLQAFPTATPELAHIVEDHLAPFLASVPPCARPARRAAGRPIPVGPGMAGRDTAALVPFRSFAQLQPLLALLAGTPEADALDLVLVTTRAGASELVERLGHAFAFYGLRGCLVIAPDHDSLAAQLDLGVTATAARRLLAWMPAALPKGPGWLARLADEAAGLPVPGLLSPALTYEDGSIYFGGAARDATRACALSGYGADWLPRGAARPAPTGAAEIALIDRAALAAVGGFTGQLFGDALAHVDLADRLRRAGLATWCSGAVDFWVLDDHAAEPATPLARMVDRIDAALLDRRAAAVRERAA